MIVKNEAVPKGYDFTLWGTLVLYLNGIIEDQWVKAEKISLFLLDKKLD